MRGEKREKVRRRRRAPRDDLRQRTEKVAKVVSHVNEMAEQKTDRSDLTAVIWFCPCRFAASLAAFAALAWLDFTLLIFGGILQVTSGSTGPPCVAGVTSHTVVTQLRWTASRRQSNRTVFTPKEKIHADLQVLELLPPRALEVSANFYITKGLRSIPVGTAP